MVKEIGDLLLLPNLEEETVKEINATLRHMVQQYRTKEPDVTPALKGVQEISQNVLNEWLNGPTKEGE